jgi:hypothetical protein
MSAAIPQSPQSPITCRPNHSADAGSPPVSCTSACCTSKPSADCKHDDDEAPPPPPLARVTVCAQLRARPPPQVQGGPPATPPVGLISRPHSGPTVAALAPVQSDLGQPHGSPCSPCTPRGNEQPKRQPPPVPPGASLHTRLVHSGEYEVATFSAACASPASSHCPSPRRCRSRGASADSATSSCRIPQPGAAPPPSPEPARDRCQASSHTGTAFLRRGRSRVTGAAACTSLPLRQRPAPAAPANTAEQRPPLLLRKLRTERNPPHSGERKGPG